MSKTITTAILGRKTHSNVDGSVLVLERTVKGVKSSVPQIILKTAYGDAWLPATAVADDHTDVTGTLFDKGDLMFVAERESRILKGSQPDFKGTPEEAKEPIYYEGDDVFATKPTFRADSTLKADRMTNARREELEFMHSLGLLKAV